ncbi:ClpXP protease specificity-enhancing factor [Thiomicrorhabdus xiamenensis]|uniref:ClpXP protease specificity-enhancing factor n=1 Tax=Thiomicrorhabdus xiamenensis TaxID=2739063 RepID=A0A7D4T9M2_9GAMM|nr:ClpXP protease specificity-enhancing factor [Thiomicrorhabdus xiamenensis]QKI88666.1 ClpXP protease specificity-enhancing factor [Thiomicrorhabdus xiamenensis]
MTSSRPYLVRAIYDWIVDNGWTPHMQVDANYPGTYVPQQFVQEGMIVLNTSPTAVVGLEMGNEEISFSARFQGMEQSVSFPPEAVLAVFARENGQGMPFPAEPYPEEATTEEGGKSQASSPLKAVEPASKGAKAEKSDNAESGSDKKKRPTLSIVK